jgi:hypothetical protein
VRHHEDGLTELDAGRPRAVPAAAGASAGPHRAHPDRRAGRDPVARRGPRACRRSTSCRAGSTGCGEGQGPGAMVALDTPAGRVLARSPAARPPRWALRRGWRSTPSSRRCRWRPAMWGARSPRAERSLPFAPNFRLYSTKWSGILKGRGRALSVTRDHAEICDGVRTPIGRYGGALSQCAPMTWPRSRSGRSGPQPVARPDRIDEVLLGDANQAGEDNRNVARMAAFWRACRSPCRG